MVPLAHAVRFLQLRGGDVNGDFVGVPTSQLAVFPGTTHFNGMARADLVVPVVTTFLDTEPGCVAGARGRVTPRPRRRSGQRRDQRAVRLVDRVLSAGHQHG